MLDLADGDPDSEANGDDEPDGTGGGDPAWIEWQTRGRHKLDPYGAELLVRNKHGSIEHEDVEDDDPLEDDDAREDDDSDRCTAGDDGCGKM